MAFYHRVPDQYVWTTMVMKSWLDKTQDNELTKTARTFVQQVYDRLAPQTEHCAPLDLERCLMNYWGLGYALDLKQQLRSLTNEGLEWEPCRCVERFERDTLLVPVEMLPWELREQFRLLNGDYKQVPWHDELKPIPGHYVHISKRDSTKVSFTQNADKGERDIQAPPQRPGRYLTAYYKDQLTEQEIRRYATMIDRAGQLNFAKTADEIEEVYINGPNSCMSHRLDEFASPIHPTAVYGDSDLQVAYIYNSSGNISARCIVWPEKKRYGRIYGDECRLEDMLQDAGYREGSLEGAKVRRIEVRERQVVMPYLDAGGQTFGEIRKSDGTICKEYFEIGGRNHADRTDGIGFVNPHECCKQCREEFPVDDMLRVDGELYCDTCVNSHMITCPVIGSMHAAGEMVEVETVRGMEMWSRWAVDHYTFWCDASLKFYSRFDFSASHYSNGLVRASHLPDDPLLVNRNASSTARHLKYWNGTPPPQDLAIHGDAGEYV